MKKILDLYTDFLRENINNPKTSSLFPLCFKTVDILPSVKKGRKAYRPVSILSPVTVLCKLYIKSLFKQMASFFENVFFSKYFAQIFFLRFQKRF